jgi:hypothetical protein
MAAVKHGATVRDYTDGQRGVRWLAGAMSVLVREEPLVEADSGPGKPAPSRIALRSGFGARGVALLIFNATAWVVWALTGAGYPWPIWVAGAWAIGLLMNAWAGVEIRRDVKPPRI